MYGLEFTIKIAELNGSNAPPTVGCICGTILGVGADGAELETTGAGAAANGDPPDNSVRETGINHFGTFGISQILLLINAII